MFDAEGRYLGRLELPFKLRSYPTPIFRNGKLYATTTDELEVALFGTGGPRAALHGGVATDEGVESHAAVRARGHRPRPERVWWVVIRCPTTFYGSKCP